MNFLLSFYCQFLLVQFTVKKKKKKVVAGLYLCCLVLTAAVHFGLNCGLMEYLEGEQHYQYPVERNLRTYMSIRDYRNPPWVSAPSYMVPPQYAPPPHPQSTSPMEEAILNLTKLMGNFVEVQKTINAQLSQKIDTMENIMDMRIDELQSGMENKLDNLQYSISVLTNHQHVHQEKVNPEEECLIDTTLEEQCKNQKEETSLMLTEEGSGKEEIEKTPKVHCPSNK